MRRATLALAALLSALPACALTDGGTAEVVALAVGAGRAVLLEAGGERVLVDAGPAAEALTSELGRALPPWAPGLDLVILTGAGRPSLGGLAALDGRLRPALMLVSPGAAQAALARTAMDRLRLAGTAVGPLVQGEYVAMGECRLTASDVPGDPPTGAGFSAVVALSCPGARALLIGDRGADADLGSAGGLPTLVVFQAGAEPPPWALAPLRRVRLVSLGRASPARPGLAAPDSNARGPLTYVLEQGITRQ
ncbi:MAG: ComEC/Rec2 family competence protein [Candidatus Dormibacteria bacterium]